MPGAVLAKRADKRYVSLTRHMNSVREEITRVCDEHDKARFDLRISPNEGVFQSKRCTNAYQCSNEQTPEEHKQENSDSFEETDDAEISHLTSFVTLCSLEEHNSDSIVQYRLSKYDCV